MRQETASSSGIDIFCPTLGRPRSIERLWRNVSEATRSPHRLIFICEAHDEESWEAAQAVGAEIVRNVYEPSYSNSIQTAYERSSNPYFLAANDDFDFQPGWDLPALEAIKSAQVVALNDGSDSPNHMQTIALVRREYVERHSGVIDMPRRVFYPYSHNYVDTEFYYTAKARGMLIECPESVVVHRHPDWGHAQDDETYRLGQRSLSEDGATFNARAHLWQNLP